MKIQSSVVSLLVAASAAVTADAFATINTAASNNIVRSRRSAFVPSSSNIVNSRFHANNEKRTGDRMSLNMAVSVGIVGATGAVGKEIVGCLENRDFDVSTLRIFGSERSAGNKVNTKFGEVDVELFDVAKARECDVVFLAVDGDFALEHAKAISEGDDGAVVIDNSVSS